MPTAVLASVAVLLAVTVLFVRLRVAFAIVIASAVLVPGPLPVRNPITSEATFTRVLLIALAIRLLFGLRNGEVPGRAWRWTTVHTAMAVFLATLLIGGVAFFQPGGPTPDVVPPLVNVLDQFLFFAVVLATVRAIGDLRWVLGVISGVLLVSAGIGVIEHFTHGSWGHFLFRTEQPGSSASDVLEQRTGHVRVRAGAEYALQYGWVTAMLLPALLSWLALRRDELRRWVPLALACSALVLLAEYWSYSRTALAAIGGIALVTALAARERRLLAMCSAGVAIGVVAFLLSGTLQNGFVGLPSGYVDVRTNRLPVIFGAVASHPWHGLGLGGLAILGIQSTDSSYLQLYGDAGLLGLVGGVAVLVCALVSCLAGLRARVRTDRLAAAAAVAGALAMLVGGVAYDALRSLSSARPFWVLIAVGIVAAERVRGTLPVVVRHSARTTAAVLIGAVVAGVVAFATAPVHFARDYEFFTIAAAREAQPVDPFTTGETFIHTVCGLAHGVELRHPGAHVDCRDLHLGAGQGELRITSSSAAQVSTIATDLDSAASGSTVIPAFAMLPDNPGSSGRPTALGWAWLWLPLAAALGLGLLPQPRRRRDPPGVDAATAGTLFDRDVRSSLAAP